mgnify:CR=1 FL=1
MVIDDNKKHIFVAIARTGSTTIKNFFKSDLNTSPEIYHATIGDIINKYPQKKDYLKWAFVRNPWDRMVSAYYEFRNIEHSKWASEVREYPSFEAFVLNFPYLDISKDIHFIPQTDCITIKGKIIIDKICRFENYQDDFCNICKILNINSQKLPKFRTTSKFRDKSYVNNYTSQDMIDTVRKFYIKDVINFEYKFGE